MLSTPALMARFAPVAPCACAATLRRRSWASPISASNSAWVSWGVSTSSVSDSTPPVAQVLMTSAPCLMLYRTTARIPSGLLAMLSSMPGSFRSPARSPAVSSQCPPVVPIPFTDARIRGPIDFAAIDRVPQADVAENRASRGRGSL